MQKPITLAALLATIALPAFASDRNRSVDKDRPAHARKNLGDPHSCSTKPASE